MSQGSSSARVVLITGGNSGIGEITARELMRQGCRVYVACRRSDKTTRALAALMSQAKFADQVQHLELDLSDFQSIKSCAHAFLERESVLDLLINNAGLAGSKGLTKSGFELTFGVCHMGHFLLTELLMPVLKNADEARVINVASVAHRHAKGIDFDALSEPTRTPGGLKEYAVAKLTNILYTRELAVRLKDTRVTSYSLHPGVVATDVWRSLPGFLQPLVKLFMVTPEQGARTTLFLSNEPTKSLVNGEYYTDCKLAKTTVVAKDMKLAGQLWEFSERAIEGLV